MSAIHKGITHKCKLCEKIFSFKSTLRKHIREIHEEMRPYKCHVCEKDFKQKSAMDIHIQAIHEKKKPNKCQLCDLKFGFK